MSVKFFGQFLLESGEVDAGHIREAIRLMKRTNRTLGQLAVEAGFAKREETEGVNRAQLRSDRPFGELAVEMGVLSRDQLEKLVRLQDERRIRLGDALVRLGYLEGDRLSLLLDRFKADQAQYEAGAVPLPPGLEDSRVARVVIDFLPKFCMRVAQLAVKVSSESAPSAPAYRMMASIAIRGGEALDVTLCCDRAFAERLAAGVSGRRPEEIDDELVTDGMGEFLNVLAGNAVSILEREGVEVGLEPPRPGGTPDGQRFELVSTTGAGALFLDRRSG